MFYVYFTVKHVNVLESQRFIHSGIFKTDESGIAKNVAGKYFLSTPYEATKTFWLAVLTLIVTSHCGKI